MKALVIVGAGLGVALLLFLLLFTSVFDSFDYVDWGRFGILAFILGSALGVAHLILKSREVDEGNKRQQAEGETKRQGIETRQREQEERERELERLAHEEEKLTLQKKIDDLKNPSARRTPDEEMFDQYLAKRTIDTRESIFKAVLLPTMTAMELEKVYEKQKIEINRDPSYTDAQKDRLLEILSQHYRKAMVNFRGSSQSIYED